MASSSKKTAAKPAVNPPPPSEAKPEKSDFRVEIEKSRAIIQQADQPAAVPTNKGGRPSNAEKAAREAAEKAAQAEKLAQLVPPAGLKQMVALPFNLAAIKTGFEGFLLTDEEAEAIVPSLHTVLATYAPQVNGESMAIMALAGALFSIGIGKYVAFLQFRGQEGTGNSTGAEAASPPAAAPGPTEGTFFPPGMHV